MINRIPFCFGNLMVRRKKIHKGCKESPKRLQKSLNCLAYYASFIKKQDFLARFRKLYNRENEEAYRSYFANMQKQAKEQRQEFNLN